MVNWSKLKLETSWKPDHQALLGAERQIMNNEAREKVSHVTRKIKQFLL